MFEVEELFKIGVAKFRDLNTDRPYKMKMAVQVSGGIDSAVLLDVVNKYKTEFNYDIEIIHIEFQDIPNYRETYEFVNKLATLYKLPIVNVKVPVDNNGKISKEKTHDIMKNVAFSSDYDAIFTGHHLNDQIETVLFRLFKGTGISGISGMELCSVYINDANKEFRYFLKPFLFVTKEKINDYAARNSIKFIQDETNFNSDCDRNYIRNIIIPRVIERFDITGLCNSICNIQEEISAKKKESMESKLNIYSNSWFINEFINLSIMNRVFVVKEHLRVIHGFNINKRIYNELKNKLSGDLSNLQVKISDKFELVYEKGFNFITVRTAL